MSNRTKVSRNLEDAEREANEIAFQFATSADPMRAMETAYGADFSKITLHTDDSADRRVKAAGRDALAAGHDIFFGRGILESRTPESRALLSHELAHTMQQGVSGGESAVSTAVPEGTAQGGLLDWFKEKLQNYKANQAVKKNESITKKNEGARVKAMKGYKPTVGTLGGAEKKAAMRKAISCQSILNSNHIYQESQDKGDAAAESISKAFLELGIRESGKEQSQAARAYKGDVFTGLDDDYMNYMQKLEAGGTDFVQIRDGLETNTSPQLKNYEHSAQSTGISSDMLSMFSSYLESPEGIEYVATLNTRIKGAHVFTDTNSVDFIMQTLMNENGAKASKLHATAAPGTFKKEDGVTAGARRTVITEASRLMMRLPVITPAEKETLPPDIRKLADEYDALRLRVREKAYLAAR